MFVKLLLTGCLALCFPLVIMSATAGEPSAAATASGSSTNAATKAASAKPKAGAKAAPDKAPAKPATKHAAKPAAKSTTKSAAKTTAVIGYGARDDVRAFAAELARDTDLPQRDVERWLAAAKFQPKIVELMDRPLLEPPKWYAYSASFLTPARIDAGVRFWRDNAAALARAEAIYGVPPEIVVAIIGVETFYGRNTGSHRVIDALATLAFDYPRRAAFFRGELKEYLLLARDQDFSPLVPRGSYAGAMGLPQFMPGSYRRFAVDFDGDGHADLWRNPTDAIGSVANYLARHDWQRGAPVLARAALGGDAASAVLRRLDGGISERRPLAAWQADGVDLRDATSAATSEPVGILLLEGGADGSTSLWIAYPNFYVITRYNKSRLYAAAVWALGERLRTQYLATR